MLSRLAAVSRPACRSFSACPFEMAKQVHATPYDEAKEGPIEFPPYGQEGCLWQKTKPTSHIRPKRATGIASSALELIGETPMVHLQRLQKHYGLECDLYAKVEMFNAGGSVKDRIALRMIQEAEKAGRIKPGDTLIEPTSGNTGIGLCMAGALKGYKVIITMPLKMSGEKLNTMKMLGATILRTPTEAGWNDTNSHIALALRLQKILPNAHVLDQYLNDGNPLAHYDGTALEILEQTKGDFQHIVMSAGTGGTMTGTARRIKEEKPDCTVVAVDPKGSILAVPDSLNDDPEHPRLSPYQVEGIGYDFIPTVLDQNQADVWVKTGDVESFKCARQVIRYEGLLVGGSSGSAMAGALKYIKQAGGLKGQKVVVLFADSTRNYMSKLLDDEWMNKHNFDTTV